MNVEEKERTDDHVYPLHPAKMNAILDDILVCGQHNLEVAGAQVRLEEFTLGRVPLYEITFTLGAHFANSPDQLVMVDNGTMTRYGARCFLDSIRKVMSEIVWIVFPRPCTKVC